MSEPRRIGDMKHGLTSSRPKMSLIGQHSAIHQVRGTSYGADKYARGNYHGNPPVGVSPVDRFAGYIDAAMRHLMSISQAINVAKGTGGDQVAACAVVDEEASGGFPPSLLPHISHVMAGMGIAVECAVADGLIPADPGEPWKQHPMYAEVLARRGGAKPKGLAQKDDPDAEHRRVFGANLVLGGPDVSAFEKDTGMSALELGEAEQLCASAGIAPTNANIRRAVWQLRDAKRRNAGTDRRAVPIVGGLAADLCPGEADIAALDHEIAEGFAKSGRTS